MKLIGLVLVAAIWIFAAGFICGSYNSPTENQNECLVVTHTLEGAFGSMAQDKEIVKTPAGGWCVRQSRVG